ncbi:hypothetical protein R3W88_023317 [Solanum pinnatisectum]|uniref:Uncharacterized protein n=1 Tax=Solanum pinnatisectum TaxID=50273 RepID=A0AAV9LX50_9SOLN|nr:hypothetical protein R3W88_023317 [Solanum pinnatisectum]
MHPPSPSPSSEAKNDITSRAIPKPPPTVINFTHSPLPPSPSSPNASLKPIIKPIDDKVALHPPPRRPIYTHPLPKPLPKLTSPSPPVTALMYPVNGSSAPVSRDETSSIKVQSPLSSASIGSVIGISVGVTGAFFIVAIILFVCCRNKLKCGKLRDRESPLPKGKAFSV